VRRVISLVHTDELIEYEPAFLIRGGTVVAKLIFTRGLLLRLRRIASISGTTNKWSLRRW
jgi:hypothetical protein